MIDSRRSSVVVDCVVEVAGLVCVNLRLIFTDSVWQEVSHSFGLLS